LSEKKQAATDGRRQYRNTTNRRRQNCNEV
jgi:hypothetical protein